jgi:hypothetical protein
LEISINAMSGIAAELTIEIALGVVVVVVGVVTVKVALQDSGRHKLIYTVPLSIIVDSPEFFHQKICRALCGHLAYNPSKTEDRVCQWLRGSNDLPSRVENRYWARTLKFGHASWNGAVSL